MISPNDSRVTLVVSILLALVAAAPAARSQSDGRSSREDPLEGGWLGSGVRSQPFDVAASTRGIAGISTRVLCPAMKLRQLLSDGDTVWIATEGGLFAWSAVDDSLSRVDGPAFTSIEAVEKDDEGRLWVGGSEGVSFRTGYGWSHYVSGKYSFFERVTGFFNSGERFWVTTFGQGCGYFQSDTLTVITRADSLLDDRVNALVEQGDRTLWAGTESGLCRADSFSWQSLRYGAGIPVGAVEDLLLDEEGNLFIAVAGQGIARYNLGRVETYGPRNGLASRWMRCFSMDHSGTVWVAGRGGASTYDGSGWIPVRMPGVNLSAEDILSVCHDTEGTTFLGTSDGRMLVVSREVAREVALPQRFPLATVMDIRQSGADLWFMSGSRIIRMGREVSELTLPGPWFEGALTAMAFDDSGGMWVTTRFGILRYDGRSWQVFDRRLGLPTEYFTWVAPVAGGDVWFGTFDSGLLKLTTDGWIHHTAGNGLPAGRIAGLVTDTAGREWVLAESGRIAVREGGAWRHVDIPPRGVSRSPGSSDTTSAPYPGIRFISGSPDEAATGAGMKGLCIGLDGEGNVLLCRSDGIYRNSRDGWHLIELPYGGERIEPSVITGTRRGGVWLGTSGQGLFIRRGGDWMRLGPASGLSDDHVTEIFEDETGRVWCGTLSGGVTLCTDGG